LHVCAAEAPMTLPAFLAQFSCNQLPLLALLPTSQPPPTSLIRCLTGQVSGRDSRLL
jgi:hypothetical protein